MRPSQQTPQDTLCGVGALVFSCCLLCGPGVHGHRPVLAGYTLPSLQLGARSAEALYDTAALQLV